MKFVKLVIQVPTGALMVGGRGETPLGLHGHSARDGRGRALIPSTTLRGALRDTFERLLRGSGQAACSGGDGVAPGQGAGTSQPCRLDEGRPCAACTLFGTQRPAPGEHERQFSALRVSDAVAVRDTSWAVRPGVAISRRWRSAEDGRLFMREMPNRPQLKLTAELELRDESRWNELQAILSSTLWMGGGRGQGAGQVEITWQELPTPEPVAELPTVEGSSLRVRLRLLSPASIGAPVRSRYIEDTRTFITGSALRGMVGWSLASSLPDPDGDAPFQSLVAEGGASFGPLYPVESGCSRGSSYPLPITVQACKSEKRKHPLHDVLLQNILESLLTPEEFERLPRVEQCSSTECNGSPLRRLSGPRGGEVDVRTLAVTRVSLERNRASARDGALFTHRLVEAGQVFEGEIRNIPSGSQERLRQGLGTTGYVGRGQAQGWGKVEVKISEMPAQHPVEQRRVDFRQQIEKQLKTLQLEPARQAELMARVDHLVVMTLLTPAVDEEKRWVDELCGQLGGARDLYRNRRFSRDGGWDQKNGKMSAFLSIDAGAVYVLELAQPVHSISAVLNQIEQEGVGGRRHQGYGFIRLFDPIHLNPEHERWVMTHSDALPGGTEPMTTDLLLRKFRKDLVKAAEEVTPSLVDTRLNKSQLNHLVNICDEAACVEEIQLYLRYQAGRDSSGWNPTTCEMAITKVRTVLDKVPWGSLKESSEQRAQVVAWRLFAVYLARDFQYRKLTSPRR